MYSYKMVIFNADDTLFKADAINCTLFNRDTIFETPTHKLCQSDEDKLFNTAKLYDGVKAMLELLENDGYTLGLCTNYSEEDAHRILMHFNLNHYFHIIKCKVDGLERSQLIKQALDESGCCSAIVVGASSIDFEATEEARCLSIGVSYGCDNDCCDTNGDGNNCDSTNCYDNNGHATNDYINGVYRNNSYGNGDYKKYDFIADTPLDIYMAIKKINGLYKEIAHQILKRKVLNKPLIVGINGVDTSGKSTFTKELERYLYKIGFKSQLVAIDDFHNASHIRNKEKDQVISYINNAFDIKKIEEEFLKPVRAQGRLNKEFLLLDLEKDEFVNTKSYAVDGDTIILFEGVLLYREPINQYFDFRIFIDISFDEVLKRAVKRDAHLFGDTIIEKYINKYIPVQKLYLEQNSPKDMSDIIIDNNDYCKPKIIKLP